MLDRRKFLTLTKSTGLSMALIPGMIPNWFEKSMATIPIPLKLGKSSKRQIISWDSRACDLPIDNGGERATWMHCSCRNYANVDWFERTASTGAKFQYFSLTVKINGKSRAICKIYGGPWKYNSYDHVGHYDHEREQFA